MSSFKKKICVFGLAATTFAIGAIPVAVNVTHATETKIEDNKKQAQKNSADNTVKTDKKVETVKEAQKEKVKKEDTSKKADIKRGWVKEAGGFKYYGKDGKPYTGWHYLGKAEGEKTPHWSYFDKNGTIYIGWHKMGKKEGENPEHWSYFGENGWLRTGWQIMGTKANPDGKNKVHWSYFGPNGWLRTGWQQLGKGTGNPDGNAAKHWSYFGGNGWLQTGWKWFTSADGEKTNHWSYFGDNGWLATGQRKIAGISYSFDGKGWLTIGHLLPDGCYKISTQSNKDYGLDIQGASSAEGALLQTYKLNGTAAQMFQIKHLGNNVYSIKTAPTLYGSALTVKGTAKNGASVIQKKYSGASSQKWKIMADTDGHYIIKTVDGKYALDTADGELKLAKSSGGKNQVFKITKTDGFLFKNGRKYYFNSNGQVPLTGIDVSKYNGTIDWKKVKADGIDFAIIRTSYGYESNYKKWEWKTLENIKGCEENGIPYGVYFYTIATNNAQADKEVDLVKKILGNRKPKLGVYIDVEDEALLKKTFGSATSAQARRKVTDLTKRMAARLKSYGYKTGVCSYSLFFTRTLYSNELNGNYIWGARYYKNNASDTNVLPQNERNWNIWQYTSNGKVNGINGVVDMNTVIKKYW